MTQMKGQKECTGNGKKDSMKTNDRSCNTCYYEAFDERAYPCSRCIYNRPTVDKWQPKKGVKNVHRRRSLEKGTN